MSETVSGWQAEINKLDSIILEVNNHMISSAPLTYFEKVIAKITEMHNKKKQDYTASHREFGNFEDSAKHAGITTAQAIENLIGTKEARRQNLENVSQSNPINESLEDTLLDRAVYACIRLAHYMSEKEANKPMTTREYLNSLSNEDLVDKIAESQPYVNPRPCKHCGHAASRHYNIAGLKLNNDMSGSDVCGKYEPL